MRQDDERHSPMSTYLLAMVAVLGSQCGQTSGHAEVDLVLFLELNGTISSMEVISIRVF